MPDLMIPLPKGHVCGHNPGGDSPGDGARRVCAWQDAGPDLYRCLVCNATTSKISAFGAYLTRKMLAERDYA